MPADPNAPMLPFVSEYTPWLHKVRETAEREAAEADATFAQRHGALSSPERPQGAVTDTTA